MRINWKNIYGILGVIFAVWFFRNFKPVLLSWFEDMRNNHEFWEKHPALPFLTVALVCVTIVAIYKIRSQGK